MTDRGLSCEGCSIPEQKTDKSGHRFEFEIDSDGVDLNIKKNHEDTNVETSFSAADENKKRTAIGILYEDTDRIINI